MRFVDFDNRKRRQCVLREGRKLKKLQKIESIEIGKKIIKLSLIIWVVKTILKIKILARIYSIKSTKNV